MNPETLRYMIALQPQFKEAMGEWQDGDWFWCNHFSCEKKSRLVKNTNQSYLECSEMSHMACDCIRLPLPIDPRNPGRGLWGMVDWSYHTARNSNEMLVIRNLKCFKIETFYGTPDLALLKALAHQWQVEVG